VLRLPAGSGIRNGKYPLPAIPFFTKLEMVIPVFIAGIEKMIE
jgi:hypothetical protein